MKVFFFISFIFFSLLLSAQTDKFREIEPDRETSFENYELLLLAVLGLLVLVGLRYWFKRTRKP